MDLLNCGVARRAILDYYQRSGEPLAVQEAIKTSQEKASKTVTMEKMKMMYVLSSINERSRVTFTPDED